MPRVQPTVPQAEETARTLGIVFVAGATIQFRAVFSDFVNVSGRTSVVEIKVAMYCAQATRRTDPRLPSRC